MAHNNKAKSATLVKLLLDIQIADVVVFNFLSITVAKLLQGVIKLAVDIAESIKGVVVANFLPTTPNKSFFIKSYYGISYFLF